MALPAPYSPPSSPLLPPPPKQAGDTAAFLPTHSDPAPSEPESLPPPSPSPARQVVPALQRDGSTPGSSAAIPRAFNFRSRTGYPAWDRHSHMIRMLGNEAKVLSVMRPRPAPPQTHTQPAVAEGIQRSSSMLAPLREGLPASTHELAFDPGRFDDLPSEPGTHSDLIHNLSLLAEQNRPTLRVDPPSWRGRVLSQGSPLARDPVHEESDRSGDEGREREPLRFRGGAPLLRSYSERPASPETPAPSSPWFRIRQRLGSLSQSVHSAGPEPETTSYAGSGWGRQRLASNASNGSAYPGSGWGRKPRRSTVENENGFAGSGWNSRPHLHRRAISDFGLVREPHAAGGESFNPTSSSDFRPRLSRQATLPLSGAPGFDPWRQDKPFGGDDTAIWGVEELARSQAHHRPEPVKLVGRLSDQDGSSGSSTHSDPEGVVSPWLASHLQSHFPARLRAGDEWELIYSIDQRGSSLKTLYSLTSQFFGPINDPDFMERTQGPFALLEKELAGRIGMTKPPILLPNRSSTYPYTRTSKSASLHRGSANEALSSTYRNGPIAFPRAPSLSYTPRPRSNHLSATMSHRDAGLVLAVRDTKGNVFGVFLNSHLRIQSKYYGSGSSFLWKVAANSKAESDIESGSSEEEEDPEGNTLVVYPWTAKNDFIVLSEAHFISFGYGAQAGSQGGYGLWLDEDFKRGSSARCATFDNDVLCSPHSPTLPSHPGGKEEEYFECLQLELWAVGLTS